MRRTISSCILLSAILTLAGCAATQDPTTARQQMRFGVEMADRGLWSEAYFRFEQAADLGVSGVELLNNLAVASEALGEFARADELYRRALELRPHDDVLRKNYERFSAFYASHQERARERTEVDPESGEPATEAETDGDD